MPCYQPPWTAEDERNYQRRQEEELENVKANIAFIVQGIYRQNRDGGINKFIQDLDYARSGLELRQVAYWLQSNNLCLDGSFNMGVTPLTFDGNTDECNFLSALLCSMCASVDKNSITIAMDKVLFADKVVTPEAGERRLKIKDWWNGHKNSDRNRLVYENTKQKRREAAKDKKIKEMEEKIDYLQLKLSINRLPPNAAISKLKDEIENLGFEVKISLKELVRDSDFDNRFKIIIKGFGETRDFYTFIYRKDPEENALDLMYEAYKKALNIKKEKLNGI